MEKWNGRALAYLTVIGQNILSIFLNRLSSDGLSSEIVSSEQLTVINHFSLFLFGTRQSALWFFVLTLVLLIIGALLSGKHVEFVSSYIKLHIFMEIMFWVFYAKYGQNIPLILNIPVWLICLIHALSLIVLGLIVNRLADYITSSKARKANGNQSLSEEIQYKCPHCDYVYHSKPEYCVNCNQQIK